MSLKPPQSCFQISECLEMRYLFVTAGIDFILTTRYVNMKLEFLYSNMDVYCTIIIRYMVTLYNVIRYNVTLYNVIRYNVTLYNVIRYHVALYNVIRY